MIEKMLDGLLGQGRARAAKVPLPEKSERTRLTIDEIRRLRAEQRQNPQSLEPRRRRVELPLADVFCDPFCGLDEFLQLVERTRQMREQELTRLYELGDTISGH